MAGQAPSSRAGALACCRTCKRGDPVLAGAAAISVCHKPRQAPYAVPAHLRLAAVGVVDAHGVVLAAALARERKNDLRIPCVTRSLQRARAA